MGWGGLPRAVSDGCFAVARYDKSSSKKGRTMIPDNQSLPPLPEPSYGFQADAYTSNQMLKYGDARAAHARKVALDQVLNCYSTDDTVTDYQDKIKEILK